MKTIYNEFLCAHSKRRTNNITAIYKRHKYDTNLNWITIVLVRALEIKCELNSSEYSSGGLSVLATNTKIKLRKRMSSIPYPD